jgi:hypothetical protein
MPDAYCCVGGGDADADAAVAMTAHRAETRAGDGDVLLLRRFLRTTSTRPPQVPGVRRKTAERQTQTKRFNGLSSEGAFESFVSDEVARDFSPPQKAAPPSQKNTSLRM